MKESDCVGKFSSSKNGVGRAGLKSALRLYRQALGLLFKNQRLHLLIISTKHKYIQHRPYNYIIIIIIVIY